MPKFNYTGIHFPNGTHMTYHYGDREYPFGVRPKDFSNEVQAYAIGQNDDGCVIFCTFRGEAYRPDGKPYHITVSCPNGEKPTFWETVYEEKHAFPPVTITGVWA